MTKLPRISGAELVVALRRTGFQQIRQHGSHIILRRDNPFAQTTVPNHKELDRGTLRAMLRQTDLTVDQLIELLS